MDNSHSPSTTPFLAPPPSQAAIIGGGFAGLLAAASLSPHFDKITILERDQVPTTESEARKTVDRLRESAEGALEYARVRRGVPQFLHCHGWLAGGLRAMNELLPGFTEDAVRAGAVPLEKARARTVSRCFSLTLTKRCFCSISCILTQERIGSSSHGGFVYPNRVAGLQSRQCELHGGI
jgi:hypothetical protein